MLVESGEETRPLGIPVCLSPQIHLSPAFAPTWSELLKKVKGGSISKRSSLIVDGEASLTNLELNGALVIRPSGAGTRVRIEGLQEANNGWELRPLGPNEAAPEEVAMRGYKLVQTHSRTLAFSDGKERLVKA
jgi:hypothetical protein